MTNTINITRDALDDYKGRVVDLEGQVQTLIGFIETNFNNAWRVHNLHARIGDLDRNDLLLFLQAGQNNAQQQQQQQQQQQNAIVPNNVGGGDAGAQPGGNLGDNPAGADNVNPAGGNNGG